ncbi:MAG: dTMP kinase [Ruminiclostridium sp.]
MLIAIIGIDGSGKTTQVELLKNANRYSVSVHKASSDDRNVIENIHFENYITYKQTMSVAMTMDLLRTYRNEISIYDNFTLNVWDRYKYCIQAYFAAEQISYEKTNILLEELRTPDLTIWLKIDPEVAEERIHKRGAAKPLEYAAFLSLVQQQYSEMLKNVNHVHVIDCNEKYADAIHKEIMDLIEQRLQTL